MTSTSARSVAAQRSPRAGRSGHTRFALASVATLGILLVAARLAGAQPASTQRARWELRVPSGGLVPTGAHRDAVKDAHLSAMQLSYVMRPELAMTATLGWARSRNLVSVDDPKLDVFTFDLGAEFRAPQWRMGHTMTLAPFAGAGAGSRSYDHRQLDVDATHNAAGYGTVGGEIGVRRVRLRLEVRDYVTGFKPLVGRGKADARNEIVIMAGLRFERQCERYD